VAEVFASSISTILLLQQASSIRAQLRWRVETPTGRMNRQPYDGGANTASLLAWRLNHSFAGWPSQDTKTRYFQFLLPVSSASDAVTDYFGLW
jgi:hypothetical protein